MVEKAIESLPLDKLDLIILENVGNLVCPAESDTGAFNADRATKKRIAERQSFSVTDDICSYLAPIL